MSEQMRAFTFVAQAGRPRRSKDDQAKNHLTVAQQIIALGGVPHYDPETDTVTAPDIAEPQLAAYPMGVLYHKGLVGKGHLVSAGLHAWAHSIVFGRRSTAMKAMAQAGVSDSLGEGDGERPGLVSMLGLMARENPECLAAIQIAYTKANDLLLKRGAHVHGVINSLVIYEVRPWWLDEKMTPEKTAGYRWTMMGLRILDRHWPSTVERMASIFSC